ncbi:hypothetical protein G3I60_05260 [Streptomyces sp. SID13666]|uniref:hypothetical protein n=1 Tax=Streptomyces sp. SID13666 TaxID=2706054 RepID=UPI0013C08A0E|nr:hypothetical protein [Streptomyces sp. SID13666]NEA53579.1 hypothetical protein [Streptomyces sp. SID13666]
MPFTVTGALDDGAAYRVQVTGQQERPVTGSRRIRALVQLFEGRSVMLTPTGPRRALDPTDEATVLAFLRQHTRVQETGAGAPRNARVN